MCRLTHTVKTAAVYRGKVDRHTRVSALHGVYHMGLRSGVLNLENTAEGRKPTGKTTDRKETTDHQWWGGEMGSN